MEGSLNLDVTHPVFELVPEDTKEFVNKRHVRISKERNPGIFPVSNETSVYQN